MTKTTRELEAKRNENVMLVAILIAVVISFGCTYIVLGVHEAKYHQEPCDIGKPEILGDYKVADSFFDARSCAVKDCVAFNKIHESIDGYDGVRCVV